MRLAELRPLFETRGWQFADLQYGNTATERVAPIDDRDVVVTISNTTSHIAGALGKEAWLMLPLNAARICY